MKIRFVQLALVCAISLPSVYAYAGPVSLTTRAAVNVNISLFSSGTPITDIVETGANGASLVSENYAQPGYTGEGYAFADAGVLKTKTASAASADGWFFLMGSAEWRQNVTFNDPTRTGQTGTTVLKHYYSSTLSTPFNVNTSAGANYQTGIVFSNTYSGTDQPTDFVSTGSWTSKYETSGGAVVEQKWSAWSDEIPWELSDQKPTVSPDNYLYLPIEFVFGETYTITAWQLNQCSQLGLNGASTTCVADSSHSAYWAGIGDVFDDAGLLVAEARLLTSEGLDFSQSLVPPNAVPEPSSVALVLAGLALAGVARRREGAIKD